MPETFKKLIWPLAALALLLVFNAGANRKFFELKVAHGRLSGATVDVLHHAAPIMLMALGMTLVIATGGIDLSVGSVMAMAGSLAAVLLFRFNLSLVWVIVVPLVMCAAAGAWNGLLVAYVRIQPIVATLILMVAGRGIAQLIISNEKIDISGYAGFAYLGRGMLAGLPFAIWIAAMMTAAIAALVRLTALGLFIESLGGNETASRFAGLNVHRIRLAVYALSGLCAGVPGLIEASNIAKPDADNAGLYMELDAILAVVIGGTALTGGRFSLVGSLIGALIIQTLTTTISMTQIAGASIPDEYNLVVKAVVVLLVCLLQSPAVRSLLSGRRGDV